MKKCFWASFIAFVALTTASPSNAAYQPTSLDYVDCINDALSPNCSTVPPADFPLTCNTAHLIAVVAR